MGPTLNRVTEEDPTLQLAHRAGHERDDPVGHGRGAHRPGRPPHGDQVRRRPADRRAEGAVSASRSPRSAADYHRHKKQTGGAGQFGEVHMEIKPLRARQRASSSTRAGCSAARSRTASSRRSRRASARGWMHGPLAGYPVVDVRCEVYDGKMHPVDSKDIAFQIAGREVFKKTFLAAGPVLLEPIMDVHDHRARGVHGRHHGRPEHPPRPRAGHGAEQGQGRSSPPRCRWPRCSAMRSTCARSRRAAASTP